MLQPSLIVAAAAYDNGDAAASAADDAENVGDGDVKVVVMVIR